MAWLALLGAVGTSGSHPLQAQAGRSGGQLLGVLSSAADAIALVPRQPGLSGAFTLIVNNKDVHETQ